MNNNTALQLAKYIVKYVYKKEKKLLKNKANLISEDFDIVDFKHLKLQKILYFLYGLYYSKTKKELFKDDFIAYKYGPVVHTVYSKIKDKYPKEPLANLGESLFKDIDITRLKIDKKVVNQILDKILQFSSWRLVELSHLENSPWDLTEQSKIIKKKIIHDYFSKATID